VPLSGLAIITGGLMVVFGVWADLGAILIIGFLVGITPIMHAFWKVEDERMKAIQAAMFFKNVALLGAAIIIFLALQSAGRSAPDDHRRAVRSDRLTIVSSARRRARAPTQRPSPPR
jgi:uncharacterized membrane protein YphA (DoxX/SURF4 family)